MRIRWLGQVPYREAWDLQRAVATRTDDDYLLLLEHPPVYTLGVNGDPGHVLVDPRSVGAELVRVDRGGDVTFHGPGQLVGYPVVSVGDGLHRGTEHVRRIEQMVIDTLVEVGLPAAGVGRLPGYPGVWVGVDGSDGEPRKICAIGVRTARGRTTHGFALNVDPDLAFFGHIVPCGIADRPVTSLTAEGWQGTMADVVEAVIEVVRRRWVRDVELQSVTARDGAARVPSTPAAGPALTAAPVRLLARPERRAPGHPSDPVKTSDALTRRLARAGVPPGSGLDIGTRKPDWLRVPARMGDEYLQLRQRLRARELVTVCEEAGCPNIYECWSAGTATFMINGDRCTRSCGFCQVSSAHPEPLDADEPERVARAVAEMGLAHAVITCVARDDLQDGGAGAFAATIAAVRRRSPRTTVEVLIADCRGRSEALDAIFDARPDVLNHNIETVARLQYAVRPSAGYARSLAVLARAKDASLTTKSGIIVGMGETEDEVLATLADLRAVGVDIVTIGQYLRPSAAHLPVARYWTPDEFDGLRVAGLALGFAHVQASPLTRSSYHAREAVEAADTASGSAGADADIDKAAVNDPVRAGRTAVTG
jgi:lipoyl synthase